MSVQSGGDETANQPVSARVARSIVRAAKKASLATLEASTGAPYASLVAVATLPSGTPVLSISSLSHHYTNITHDNRVSLLFDGTPATGDPLVGGRVTVSGRLEAAENRNAQKRFMARHRDAFYTGFGDFEFFTVVIERVHFVAGFGRVRWFKEPDFLLAGALEDAEADIIAHMNTDHGDAAASYATGLLGQEPGEWRLSGVDIEGADLECDGVCLRLDFPEDATTPEDTRKMLVALARKARGG